MSITPNNNTYKHISDESKYSTFDPAGTNFPQNVKNVQEALSLTAPTSYATETLAGVITLATRDEVLAGIDATKAVTPATLNERLKYPDATTTVKGILYLATDVEVLAGTDASKAVTPATLKGTLDWSFANRTASETNLGVIRLSTTAAASGGVDDTTAMTPLKVRQAISAATSQIPSYASATEDAQGLVRLATIGQVQQGTIRDGFAISPYTLARVIGSNSNRGMVQAATHAQAIQGTDESLYISAVGFKNYIADNTNVGTVRLTDAPGTAGPGIALSSNATVLNTNGTNQTVQGTVNFAGAIQHQGSNLASEQYVQAQLPIGSVMMYAGQANPDGGVWVICDGPQFNKNQYPKLFAVIGYTHGGSGDIFYGPDMRGLFVRGVGIGRDIQAEIGIDDKGKPKLGNGAGGGRYSGEVQKQQVRKHQHIMAWGETYGEPSFGETRNRQGIGSGKSDGNNPWFFTNDGTEIEPVQTRTPRSTVNSEGLMGEESRPWNMSMNYIIKVA